VTICHREEEQSDDEAISLNERLLRYARNDMWTTGDCFACSFAVAQDKARNDMWTMEITSTDEYCLVMTSYETPR